MYINKIDRAQYIAQELNSLYPNPKIPLDHLNNFTLMIAVILSAQSTDKKVNELTPDLFLLAKTPSEMFELGEKTIFEKIRQLGLSKQKAKYIYKTTRILINEFNGTVPKSFKELEKLPGVGHKTASVVMSQAFGIPAFPVDTHIHRLAQRWELSTGNSVISTEKDLKALFPKSKWNKLHLQIIYYGREFCTARGCDGTKCPLCKKLFPERKTPIKLKKA